MDQPITLRNVGIFAGLSDADLELVGREIVISHYQAGETILSEGDANRALHLVRAGRVRVSREIDGDDMVLTDLVAGEAFGELSLLDEGLARATLRAVAPTEVASLSFDVLAAFLERSPAVAAAFWRAIALELCARLVQTNDVVRGYFEMNRALVENPKLREVYAKLM